MRPRVVTLPLPAFDPNGKCPACDRVWAFDRQCRCYVLTSCDRFPHHIHRKCMCGRETMELDPAAVEGRDFVFAPCIPEDDAARSSAIARAYNADLRAHFHRWSHTPSRFSVRDADDNRDNR